MKFPNGCFVVLSHIGIHEIVVKALMVLMLAVVDVNKIKDKASYIIQFFNMNKKYK